VMDQANNAIEFLRVHKFLFSFLTAFAQLCIHFHIKLGLLIISPPSKSC
jgi:hypothetical protein